MAVSRTEGGLGLMSCVRESSPPDLPDAEDVHHEPKKRKFHPFRGLRRMFRRKERSRAGAAQTVTVSADELSHPGVESRERHGAHTAADDPRRSSNALHSGLSLSHDSVFSPEQRSGPESGSELETSSSLSMQRLVHANTNVQAELVDAVRRRRARDDTSDEEDLGLPRSPPSNSPTAADVLEKVLKENVNKSNHSTCSDGSLLSMGSSEMDEDSYDQSSGHGSKLSLHDKKSEPTGVEVTSEPLSHTAARHKMSVKPKRTHGVPRKRRSTQLGEVTTLPATPEVNEESNSLSVGRSVTPDLPATTDKICHSKRSWKKSWLICAGCVLRRHRACYRTVT
uniref:Uncharacterized protein n=1 Tax=Cuerna arida TaxID=1464854 RepID=A0A1B6H2S2_9HEMI